MSTGQILGRATIVRVGDDMWIDRTVIKQIDRTIPLGLATLMFRGETTPRYVKVRSTTEPFAAYLAYPLDPAALLDRVAVAGAEFEGAGSSEAGGTERTRFRAELSVTVARQIGVRDVTVWVDAQGLPVQLSSRTAAQGRITYSITPYEGTVDVSPPQDSEVEETGRSLPDATGPYSEVVSTRVGDTPVRVLYSPAELGWTCWKVESDPAFRGLNPTRPSGGTCTVAVDPADAPSDQWAIPLGSVAELPYYLLGLVVPPGSTVEFSPLGGAPVTVTALPNGLALYAGPRDQPLGLATVRTPEVTLVCGPVGIDNRAGFDERQRAGAPFDEYLGVPWACLDEASANSLSE